MAVVGAGVGWGGGQEGRWRGQGRGAGARRAGERRVAAGVAESRWGGMGGRSGMSGARADGGMDRDREFERGEFSGVQVGGAEVEQFDLIRVLHRVDWQVVTVS